MKVFTEETMSEGKPNVHLLMLNTKEAKVLVEILEAACRANKRKRSFRKFLLAVEKLPIY